MIETCHKRLIEAVLFTSTDPMPETSLARYLPPGASVAAVLVELRADYAGRGVELVQSGHAWAFRTALDVAGALSQHRTENRLGRAALEVLAIIAYHQPVTRADIETIRGVSLGKGVIDSLASVGWIAPGGRKDGPGRPFYWQTTDVFLDHFRLGSLRELPNEAELREFGLLDAPETPHYHECAEQGKHASDD